MENMNIIRDEMSHLDSDKENNKYYIGVCKYYPHENYIIMLCSVSPSTFMKYSISNIKNHLREHSATIVRRPKINIMKLSISPIDETYRVIIKTHWLRIVQRHWKRVYREHLQQQCSPMQLYNNSLYSTRKMRPRLCGMLNMYNREKGGGGA